GKIDTPNILDFYELASHGFVILASQYRGNDGGEGREEFGGADVNDVINLLSIAASLPDADPKNVFLYGLSRGGMMTFLALQRGDDEEVPVSQALAFATKLSALHKPYELVVYANEIHEAANNRRDRDARIVAWFRRFLR